MANKENKSIGGRFMEKEDKEETGKTAEKQEGLPEAAEEPELEEKEEETEEAAEKEEKEIPAEEAEAEAKEEEMPTPAEEKAKPPPKEEKAEEEEIVEERIYTVPLGKAWIMPPNKRSPRAVRMLRSFIVKHMKLEARKEGEAEEEEEPKQLIISNEVNEKMWERGIEKPPRKIRVRAAKDKEGNVTVYLAEGD
jgi:large subunit ribosomal protein L31e